MGKLIIKTIIWCCMVIILTPYFLIVSDDKMRTTMDKIMIWLDNNRWFDL